MVTSAVLVDTGPLVALLREGDQHHAACTEQARLLTRPMLTCWPVITEAAYLLKDVRPLLRMIRSGKLICLELDDAAVAWMDSYAATYQSLTPQLADISLVYLAEREHVDHIFTLDRRDFNVYRSLAGEPFQLLPTSL